MAAALVWVLLAYFIRKGHVVLSATLASGLLYSSGYLPFSVQDDFRYMWWTLISAMIGLCAYFSPLGRDA